ncbi:MAG: hypothetical protein ABIJ53_10305, partial [Verrucomicrobiota bacterium]
SAFYSSAWCHTGGRTLAPEDACQLMYTNNREVDREAAYRAAADPGEEPAALMARLLRMRNQTAKRYGYNDYLGLVSGTTPLDKGMYAEFLERVDDETRTAFEAYQQDNNVQQIWNWAASVREALADLDARMPVDSQKTLLTRTLAGWGFEVDDYPVYFHLTEDQQRSAYADVLVIDAPEDIRIVGNLRPGLASFQHLIEAAGLALSIAETRAERSAFARFDDPAWHFGITSFFRQMTSTESWLTGVLGLTDAQATRAREALGVVRLLEIRGLLVDAAFEYEAYSSGNREPNELYWQLFERYLRLTAHKELQPWAGQRRFLTEPLSSLAELQGRAIAAQTISYLQNRYGDLAGNPDVRSFLVENYFRFGSRYHWRELVERGTGEDLNPKYLNP